MSDNFQSEYPTGKIGYDAIKSTLDLNVQNSNIQWSENIPIKATIRKEFENELRKADMD